MTFEMDKLPRPDLQSHEYIKETEACGHGNKEVAGDHLMSMISQKGRPALILTALRARQSFDILADSAWRESNLKFEPELICNSLLAPGILGCHSAD